VKIIDKRPHRQEISKALVVQVRSLEIMDLCGLIDGFLQRGYPAPGLNIGLHGSGGAAVNLRHLDTRYPYMLVIPQNETENIIEDRLNQEGVYVDRSCQFVTLRQSEAGVGVTVRNREGIEEEVRVDYVIGCDGTHSTVRESIGMPFHGTEIDWTVFLADVKLDAHFIRSRITNFTGRRGFISVLPFMGEYARIFAVDFEKQHIDVDEQLTLPDLQDTVDAILPARVTLRVSAIETTEMAVASWLGSVSPTPNCGPQDTLTSGYMSGSAIRPCRSLPSLWWIDWTQSEG
jgi:2-polyprenyl-6-methoxyphenol hydroxylase-like FAD-dependent oxidoreductase